MQVLHQGNPRSGIRSSQFCTQGFAMRALQSSKSFLYTFSNSKIDTMAASDAGKIFGFFTLGDWRLAISSPPSRQCAPCFRRPRERSSELDSLYCPVTQYMFSSNHSMQAAHIDISIRFSLLLMVHIANRHHTNHETNTRFMHTNHNNAFINLQHEGVCEQMIAEGASKISAFDNSLDRL